MKSRIRSLIDERRRAMVIEDRWSHKLCQRCRRDLPIAEFARHRYDRRWRWDDGAGGYVQRGQRKDLRGTRGGVHQLRRHSWCRGCMRRYRPELQRRKRRGTYRDTRRRENRSMNTIGSGAGAEPKN
jgi:hypothetical protein